MTINREPDKEPQIQGSDIECAMRENKQLLQVHCFANDESDYISFIAMSGFLPSVGEKMHLDGGKVYLVTDIQHKVEMYDVTPNLKTIVTCRLSDIPDQESP